MAPAYCPVSRGGGRWCDVLYFDVFDYIKLCRDHYEKAGLGADYVNSLFR